MAAPQSISAAPGEWAVSRWLHRGWRWLSSGVAQETCLLAGVQVAAMAMGLASGRLITRELGPQTYGTIATVMGLIAATSPFFRFGVFTAVKLLVVRTAGRREIRQVVASGVLFGLGLGAFYCVAVASATLFLGRWYGPGVVAGLRWMLPLLAVVFVSHLVCEVAVAAAEVPVYAKCQLLRRMAWLGGGAMLIALGVRGCAPFLLLQQIGYLAVVVFAVRALRPSFRDLGGAPRKVLAMTRHYGLHQYSGLVCDHAAYAIIPVMLPAAAGARAFGFFALARLLSRPAELLAENLFRARFRHIAGQGVVPMRYWVANLLCVLVPAGCLLVVQRWVVQVVFGPAFAPVSGLVPILVLAAALHGAYMPVHTALSGWGDRRFKYCSFLGSGVSFVVMPILISAYGVSGAAWSEVIRCAWWLVLCSGFYVLFGGPWRARYRAARGARDRGGLNA